ncbi:MAG: HAMP domain-containing sensor histidine kinase, partial [Cyclobacteriaceae bacterium]
QLEKIKLKELLDEVISDLSFGDGPVKIKFKTNITEDISLLTDPSRLRVVLNNIVSNCIKYSNPKADMPNVNIHYARNGEKHRIDIQDNGIGIGENHLEKIFDMFYRASETSRGSGLGLYIVKETMNKLRGAVRVNSKLGEGTTFQIELPIVEESETNL